MIKVLFFYDEHLTCQGFRVKGHANHSDYGSDVVCAGVSSAVQMCCNGITEILKAKVKIDKVDGEISLQVEGKDESVQVLLKSLRLQLLLISKEYGDYVKIKAVKNF